MGGYTDFHVHVIEGGIQTSEVTIHPAPVPGRVELRCDEFLTFIGFIGISADTDPPVAYLNADEYLTKISDSGPQGRLVFDVARSRVGRAGWWAPPTPAARSACGLRSSTSRSNTPRPSPYGPNAGPAQ